MPSREFWKLTEVARVLIQSQAWAQPTEEALKMQPQLNGLVNHSKVLNPEGGKAPGR